MQTNLETLLLEAEYEKTNFIKADAHMRSSDQVRGARVMGMYREGKKNQKQYFLLTPSETDYLWAEENKLPVSHNSDEYLVWIENPLTTIGPDGKVKNAKIAKINVKTKKLYKLKDYDSAYFTWDQPKTVAELFIFTPFNRTV